MAEIACQRRGLLSAFALKRAGTTQVTLYTTKAVPLKYSLADPLATVPPDDLLAPEIVAHVIADPATYMGGAPVGYFDSKSQLWLVVTFAGFGKILVVPQIHQGDIDDWLTQPDKTLPGPPPVTILSPYGILEKQWVILLEVQDWGVLAHESQA